MDPPKRTTGRVKKAKVIFDPSDIPQIGTENQRKRATRRSNANIRPRAAATRNQDKQPKQPIELAEYLLNNKEAIISSDNSTCGIAVNVCVMCSKPDTVNPKNKLISCIRCKKQTHVYCLPWNIEDVKVLRTNYKCVDCRSCHMCDAFYVAQSKSDNVITCCKCIKTYHLTCHIPNVQPHQKLQRNWKCNKCHQSIFDEFGALCLDTLYRIIGVVPDNSTPTEQPSTSEAINLSLPKKSASSINNSEVAATSLSQSNPQLSDVQNGSTNQVTSSSQCKPQLPMELPDVQNWNANQVTEFFYDYFPNDAQIFQEQHIDGKSLLLLKRNDIIGKFSPKLGRSLRMYSLILKLQTRLNDDTLGWN